MKIVTEPSKPAVQFKLASTGEKLSEAEIIEGCRSGKYGRHIGLLVSENGSKAKVKVVGEIPALEQAVTEFERSRDEQKTRHAAEFEPDRLTPLALRLTPDADASGQFLADQIRYRMFIGDLPATAQFRHPDYADWFPCVSLIKDWDADSLLDPNTKVLAELKAVRSEVAEVKVQAAKTKWATRATALMLVAIVYCGVKIVIRISAS